MTISLAEATEIRARESQLRIVAADASAAISLVRGMGAVQARNLLRFGPGRTYEQVARLLDKALAKSGTCGHGGDTLVVAGGTATAVDDIVRIRRKAHGVADWISSPASDVTITLRPQGLVATDEQQRADSAPSEPAPTRHAENPAELRVRDALYDVIDPDLGVNVVDLGFVREITLDEAGEVTIVMTLTSAACPLTEVMERNISAVLSDQVRAFRLQWEWLPSWKPSDISADGREQLQAIGFSHF
ncbi:iron-sulfur cluster assembly protein [Rudaeicoccus suwonensis]|uniref:50S ribosomal protein L22 n=1 Tax=Rudaeicoccus suwonensis TaxID=657409 RepID=A0A561E2Z1_9MICO|nr:iron-sulfur cluster assembly protein [Rudaeicoccus suwonensis]TWE09985.1 metal-sulfur cluster biosynthetic enzyme [Rudaeicoccus suwonensis]